jgi:hypothetical protein
MPYLFRESGLPRIGDGKKYPAKPASYSAQRTIEAEIARSIV